MVGVTGHLGPVRFAGRYVILERLAVGGMGEVFLARQEGIGGFSRTVVLKTLLPDAERDEDANNRFLDEARVAASLSHENVVTVIEAGEHDGSPFLALEYVHGTNASTLRARARKADIPIPVVVAARIVADAARGLAHAHRAVDVDGRALHIVHRDVSPKNIFVRVDGTSKIGDFGIARSDHRIAKTSTGMVPGTLPYMSPEQAHGDLLTPASDQFSLGIVLWELLMGERLFKADSATETVMRVMTYEAPAPSTLREEARVLDRVVMRMLEHNTARRYPDLDEVAAAIEERVPEARLEVGEKAVASFVDMVCGAELRDRKARIEGGPDATAYVRRGSAVDEAPTAVVGADGSGARAASSNRGDNSGENRGDNSGGDTAPTRQDRRSGALVSPAPARLPTGRRTLGLLLAASAAAAGMGLWAAAGTPSEPSGEERTRAELVGAVERQSFLHHAIFLAMAELHDADMPRAEVIAGPLVELLRERLRLLQEHWACSADERDARAAQLMRDEQVITDKVRALLAPLGEELAAISLDMWAYDSSVPVQWLPKVSAGRVQVELKAAELERMRSQADLRQIAVERLVRRGCSSEDVLLELKPIVLEREAVITRWADAPLEELEALDDRKDALERSGRALLARRCGDVHGRAIANVAFHLINDPDEPEGLHPHPPRPLVPGSR